MRLIKQGLLIIFIITIPILMGLVSPMHRKFNAHSRYFFASSERKLFSPNYFYHASLYGHPKIKFLTSGISIKADKAPAGIVLYFKLDPKLHYKVKIVGQAFSNYPYLEIKRYSAAQAWESSNERSILHRSVRSLLWQMRIAKPVTDWIKLGNEAFIYRLRNTKILALKIYGTKDLDYLLHAITITSCTNCPTNENLRQLIIDQNPRLTHYLATNKLQAATLLTSWVANNFNYALNSELAHSFVGDDASNMYYNYFKPDLGASYSSGAALFLTEILQLFGLHAFTIDIGMAQDDLTYATTVLVLRNNEKWHYYIFDPTFNETFYRRKDGVNATIDETLMALNNHRFNTEIVVREAGIVKRDYLTSKDIQCTQYNSPKLKGYYQLKTKKPMINVCEFHGNFAKLYVTNFAKALRRHQFKLDSSIIPQLLRRKLINVGKINDPKILRDFVHRLAIQGVSIGVKVRIKLLIALLR